MLADQFCPLLSPHLLSCTLVPPLPIFSCALHFSPTSQRDSERKRDSMLTATISSSSLLFQLLSLPAHTPLPLTGCSPGDFHQLSEAVLPPPSAPAASAPSSCFLLLLTTRMWQSVALLLSGLFASIHGEPVCLSLFACLSFILFFGECNCSSSKCAIGLVAVDAVKYTKIRISK